MLKLSSKLVFFVLTIICLSFPLAAKDKTEQKKEEAEQKPSIEETKFRYAPEFCDFEMTFPDAPYKARKCPEGAKGKCYNLNSYTMVYDHRTTIDVSVTCVPSTAGKYERYSEAVIHTALKGMTKRMPLTDYKIDTVERKNSRHGFLIGNGTRGRQDTIYNAQLWIGQNSVMSVEATLIGAEHPTADQVFSEILRTIHEKGKKPKKESKDSDSAPEDRTLEDILQKAQEE